MAVIGRSILFVALLLSVLARGFVTSFAAPAGHLVISEIQTTGGTGATTDEFVELYNPIDVPISLNGWSLTKKTASGTVSVLVDNFGDRSIPAQGFFLIAHPTGYTALTLPDVRYTTTASLSDDNTVILIDPSTNVVDRVGFGSAIDREGTSVSNPGAKKSVERKASPTSTAETMAEGGADEFTGNGEDTDDNQLDFTARPVPQPQNSQSATESLTNQTVGPVVQPTASTTKVTPAEPPPNRAPTAIISPFEPDRKVRDVLFFSAKDSGDPDRDSLSYAWTFGNGERATGREVSYAYQKPGRFTLTLTVDDGRGGRTSATERIRITAYDLRRGVLINEFLPNPADDESNEWIELSNTSKDRINLDGWSLLVNDKRYRLEPTAIEPGRFFLLVRDQTKLALPNTGATLALRDPNGQVVQSVEYGSAPAGSSFGRRANATWSWSEVATPGAANDSVVASVLGASVEKEAPADPSPGSTTTEASAEATSAPVAVLPKAGASSTPSAQAPVDVPPDDSRRRLLILLAIILAGSGVGLIGWYIRKRLERRNGTAQVGSSQ